MANTSALKRINKKQLIYIAVFILAAYIILPQIKEFKSSLHLLTSPKLSYLSLSILFSLVTFISAALTYYLLSFKKLLYREVLLVQLAATFINRLLPAGIGAIGSNYEYLRHSGQTKTESATVVTINNVLGLIGHFLLLILCLLIFSGSINKGSVISTRSTVLMIGLSLLIIVVAAAAASLNKRVKGLVKGVLGQLNHYRRRPAKPIAALVSQMSLTLFNVLCLEYSAAAVGIHLSFITYFIIFTIGAGARNVTPTPGGLGGFEAGLVGGFIAYNIGSSNALAAALLFRLISFWLPLILGLISFLFVQKWGWFKVSENKLNLNTIETVDGKNK